MVLAAARLLAERARAGGHRALLAGFGAAGLAAWAAHAALREAGLDLALVAEIGLYGYVPRPCDPYLFNFKNLAACTARCDSATALGLLVQGPEARCLASLGAAQVDAAGRLNTTRLEDGTLLVGSGGLNDVASAAQEVVVTVPSGRERLVEAVPSVTGPGERVTAVVTDLGVFEKPPGPGRLRLTRLVGPLEGDVGAHVQALRARCGFAFEVAHDPPVTPSPSPDEVARLRLLDPARAYLDPLPRCAPGPRRAAEQPWGAMTGPVFDPRASTHGPPPGLGPGVVVGGGRIERLLGRGAMGEVYLATQSVLELERPVALKVVRLAETAERARRFRREVETLGRIRHPNVVSVHGAGVDGDLGYIAMALIEGESLGARLARDPPGLDEGLRLVRDVARGVACAHALGVVHRDLKPDNVLLDRAGTPFVADFGLARLLAPLGASASGGATQEGLLVGTPAYASPEQLTGDVGLVGPASDVFALGVLLYEVITGQRPFAGASLLDITLDVLRGPPAPPSARRPGLPTGLDAVCAKALQAEPQRRYPDAGAFADDLDRVLAGLSPQAGPRRRRAPWPRAAVAAAAVLLMGAMAVALVVADDATAPDPRTAAPPRRPLSAAIPEDGRGDAAAIVEQARRGLVSGCPDDALALLERDPGPRLDAWRAAARVEALIAPVEGADALGPDAASRLERVVVEETALALATGDGEPAARVARALEALGPRAPQALRELASSARDALAPHARGQFALPADLGLPWDAPVERPEGVRGLDRAADRAEAGGNLPDALVMRRDALVLNPRDAWLWIHHAGALTYAGRTGEALEALALATALEPEALGELPHRLLRLCECSGPDEVVQAARAARGGSPHGAGVAALSDAVRLLLGPAAQPDRRGPRGAPAPRASDTDIATAHEDASAALSRFPSWFALRGARGLLRLRLGFQRAGQRDLAAYLAAVGARRGSGAPELAVHFVAAALASSGDEAAALALLQRERATLVRGERAEDWSRLWAFERLADDLRLERLAPPR